MNIQDAKEEIKRTFRAYTKKTPDGKYRIPTEKQRPILIIGPPGIGKTAIMKQIAQETGAGLVAYSMTHHTRQSAIGLPYISQKEYGGTTHSVTEYTMSEIVASLYDYMESTGKREGILFLDEINCVSETLTPVMLQLLQNKSFGTHTLPEGWVIAAAGNPPEYNKSVRELDMVTLDRVKHMEIAADLDVWQRYSRLHGVHDAIRSYLTIYPEHFYCIEQKGQRQQFVTARGWEDLSTILLSYEEDNEEITQELMLQYLQHEEIAHSFYLYYDLFHHFTENPGSLEQLSRDPSSMKEASPAQCLAIASLLFHRIQAEAITWGQQLQECEKQLQLAEQLASYMNQNCQNSRGFFQQKYNSLQIRRDHGLISPSEDVSETDSLRILEEKVNSCAKTREASDSMGSSLVTAIQVEMDQLKSQTETISQWTEDACRILMEASSQSSLLYLITDLSGDTFCSKALNLSSGPLYREGCSKVLMQSL